MWLMCIQYIVRFVTKRRLKAISTQLIWDVYSYHVCRAEIKRWRELPLIRRSTLA
jgi:hypothetical protein